MKILYYSWDIKKEFDYPYSLKLQGYDVLTTSDEDEVMYCLENNTVELFILDTNSVLNYKKFFKFLCKKKEENKEIFCIAITSLDNKFILEEALYFGLNDYILENIKISQFIAKIDAFIYLITKNTVDSPKSNIIRISNLEINKTTHEAKRGNTNVFLTQKEYELILLLFSQKNNVVTRETIFEKIWNKEKEENKNIGDVYINFLRRKIDKDFDYKIIKTVRGIGYMIKD